MKLCLEDILKAVEGKCLNEEAFDTNKQILDIVTDSRAITASSLFVPLKGENFDGHVFIKDVYDKGSIVTLTMNEEVVDSRLCTILVEDTGKALLDLGHYYRNLFDIPVIGITGSVGKTSTKEIVSAILSGRYNVHKTQGNYNNEIGVPLTLFKLRPEHEIAVIEMGMNHFGEIHNLSYAATPNMGIITNIGTSHIENLGSREGILKAKLEILDGMEEGGKLIVCGDNDLLGSMPVQSIEVVPYGFTEDKPYRATNIVTNGEYTSAHIQTPSESYDIEIKALGEHMIYNVLAGIAVAEACGLTEEEIKQGLKNYAPAKMRMHITKGINNMTLIDDTYNASPESMKAALKVLKDYESKGRKVAVLGDMLEQGEFAPDLHASVGEAAAALGIDLLCAVGPLARHIYEGAKKAGNIQVVYYETKEAWMQNKEQFLQDEDTLLFKASRGMHFEEMVEELGKVKSDGK